MGESEKVTPLPKDDDIKPEVEVQEKESARDKLRKKLEKLKKDDPNIYPVF